MVKKKKIMILDDDMEFVIILKNYIDTQKDMEIINYSYDGTDALKFIKETNPDVILLDIVMQGKDGLTVLEEMSKEIQHKMPIAFVMSSIGHDKVIQKAISLGAMYYFIKPFNIISFTERVRDLITPYNSM